MIYRQRKNKLLRLDKLFACSGKQHIIAGIRANFHDKNGAIYISEPSGMMNVWSSHWSRTFSRPAKINIPKAENYANKYMSNFDFSKCQIPSLSTIKCFLLRTVDSATGPDCIPYSAFRGATDICADIIYEIMCCIRNGGDMLSDFNDMLKVFIPKMQMQNSLTYLLKILVTPDL